MRNTVNHLLVTFFIMAMGMLSAQAVSAQELNAKVSFNTSRVQGTKKSMFETLQKDLTEFINLRHWTDYQYAENERIDCSFSFTIDKYDESAGTVGGTLIVQSSRPVFQSSYTSPMLNHRDADINFTYQEFDKIEYREDMIDNNLTAIIAYYAYLIIGLDLDTMSPMGGTEVLHKAENVVNNAQSLGSTGWKAFDDSKNRFGIINDYLDGSMEPLRQMMAKYHREGLDVMATSAERGRNAITESIRLLKKAHDEKPINVWPQLFTEFKKQELADIYKGKGPVKEREEMREILMNINASQSNYWEKITK